jgi:hypothetical protein
MFSPSRTREARAKDDFSTADPIDAAARWRFEPVYVARRFWRGVFYGALLSLLCWALVLTILYWKFL